MTPASRSTRSTIAPRRDDRVEFGNERARGRRACRRCRRRLDRVVRNGEQAAPAASTAAVSISEPPQRTRRTVNGSADSTAEAVGGERQIEDRGGVGDYLVAHVGAGRHHDVGRRRSGSPRPARRPTPPGCSHRAAHGAPGGPRLRRTRRAASARPSASWPTVSATTSPSERANVIASNAAATIAPRSCSTSTSDPRHAQHTDLGQQVDHGGQRRRCPGRGRRRASTCSGGDCSDSSDWPPGAASGSTDGDGDLLRRQTALHRRVAGQVDALLDPDDGRQREREHHPAGIGLPLDPHRLAVERRSPWRR